MREKNIRWQKVNEKERDGIQKLKDADIVEKLREVLCEKKCLVILDDIWDIETLNILDYLLLGNPEVFASDGLSILCSCDAIANY